VEWNLSGSGQSIVVGFCEHGNGPFEFQKRWRISWPTEQQLASQKRPPSSYKLISFLNPESGYSCPLYIPFLHFAVPVINLL